MSVFHALKWSFLSELASKAIQPIVFVILARLLSPEDYGVMSSAIMVIAFSQIFWEAGMGKALIQKQTNIEDAANAAFWINIVLGIVIAIFLYLFANQIAFTFFHDNRVSAVLRVMTLQIILGSFSSVHNALLQKEMGFEKLFWVRFATVSLPGLASIPLAWNGMGYWALVAGTLLGQTGQVIMLWYLSKWRPKRGVNLKVVKDIGRFGAWVGISGMLGWFYVWADSLIVGMYMGSHDLGLYRTGNQFAIMIFAIIFGPITPVLYSQLSKMNAEKKSFSVIIGKLMKLFALMSIPIALLIYSIRNEIELYVFGGRWIGVGLVIGVMTLTHGISYITSFNGEAYRAAGKPKYETLVMALPAPVYLYVYIVLASHGLLIFLIGRFLVMLLIASNMNLWLSKKLFGIKYLDIVGYTIYILIVSCVFVLYRVYFDSFFDTIWVVIVMTVIFGSFTTGLILYYTKRKEIVDILKTIRG